MRLGIISDTHGLLREEALEQLNGCDAILHAGDIDRAEILEKLREIAPLYAVCGNADEKWAGWPEGQRTPAYAVRGNADEKRAGQRTPVPLYFPERPEGDILPLCADIRLEGIRICMAHKKKDLPRDLTPYQLVVTGHTHKYAQTEEDGVIFLNPGSCGPARGKKEATMAIAETEGERIVHIERIAFAAGPEEALHGRTDLKRTDIEHAMKCAAKGKPYTKIASDLKISDELAEEICRMYFTHPGVDADGIMRRLGL